MDSKFLRMWAVVMLAMVTHCATASAYWQYEPQPEVCVITGPHPDGGGCNCIRTTFQFPDGSTNSVWDGCAYNEENPLPCVTTCDCSDRFGGIISSQRPDNFPTSNVGSKPRNE